MSVPALYKSRDITNVAEDRNSKVERGQSLSIRFPNRAYSRQYEFVLIDC